MSIQPFNHMGESLVWFLSIPFCFLIGWDSIYSPTQSHLMASEVISLLEEYNSNFRPLEKHQDSWKACNSLCHLKFQLAKLPRIWTASRVKSFDRVLPSVDPSLPILFFPPLVNAAIRGFSLQLGFIGSCVFLYDHLHCADINYFWVHSVKVIF